MAEKTKGNIEVWAAQEKWVCDALLGGPSFIESRNAFGLKPIVNPQPDISYASGLAAGGIRVSVKVSPQQLSTQINALQQAVRSLLPIVVFCPSAHFSEVFASAAFCKAILLRASHGSEYSDMLLIAHKVAEQSLIPVVLTGPECADEDAVSGVRDVGFVRDYLGFPAQVISCPTPAQTMVFGTMRRHIPRWHSPDTSMALGAQLSAAQNAYAQTAHSVFFLSHADALIEAAFTSFAQISGRQTAPYKTPIKATDTLIVTPESEVADRAGSVKLKGGISAFVLRQCYPLPEVLKKLAQNSKRIIVFESSANAEGAFFEKVAARLSGISGQILGATYSSFPAFEALSDFIAEAEKGKIDSGNHALDVNLWADRSAFPKHEVHLQTLSRTYPDLKYRNFSHPSEKPKKLSTLIPMSVRRYADKGPVYSKVSDFFEREAFFTDTSSIEWVVQPIQALSAMPPATADFGRSTADRTIFPVFKSGLCTGCADCALHCPYGAIPPVALGFSDLIKSGVEQARKAGNTIGKVVPLQKAWAAAADKAAANWVRSNTTENQPASPTAAELLSPAFDEVLKGAKAEGDKAEALRSECADILNQIGALPVALTEKLFLTPHETEAGKGALFTLAIDPNACMGCGICASVCLTEALEMQTPEILSEAGRDFYRWESLPDTPSQIIENLLASDAFSPLSALMLSRNYYRSMSGGGKPVMEESRAALHLLITVAEAVLQPRNHDALHALSEIIEALSARITSALSGALPVGHIEDLGMVMRDMQTGKVSVDEILQHPKMKEGRKLLDREVLMRQSSLLAELQLLREIWESGPSGHGRSRYTLVLDASLKPLVEYPENPFTAPVIFWDGNSAQTARGIVESHVFQAIEEIKLQRRAGFEAEGEYNPLLHERQLDELTWDTLSSEEKKRIPPAIFAAGRELLSANSGALIAELCASGLPVKVVILDGAQHHSNAGFEWSLSHASLPALMIAGNVYLHRSSLADHRHLYKGWVQGFQADIPALLWVHTPQTQSAFAGQTLHQLAVHSRTFTHFDYHPQRQGKLYSSRLHIEGNPSSESDWCTVDLQYNDASGSQTLAYKMTPADWFFHFAENATRYVPMPDSDHLIPVADYLLLSSEERSAKTPSVARVSQAGALKWYGVPNDILIHTEALWRSWKMLQEWAGVLTEFPDKLKSKAANEAAETYLAEKADLIAEYEGRIVGLEAEYLQKVRQQIRDKLVELSLSSSQNT
jgi:ferredoxin